MHSRPNRRARTLAGFTLIELLVVIAILSLLAAILFPVFTQARRKAYQAQCASNLKQIGLAILQYQQDYDGVFVPYQLPYAPNAISTPEYSNSGQAEWLKGSVAPATEVYLLQPYVKNDDVRLCTTRTERYSDGASWQEGRYTMNGQFGAGFTSPQGQPDESVQNPANTLIVWEHYWSRPYCGWAPPTPGGTPTPDEERHWESSHHGGLNMLWCDGHVKRMRYRQLSPAMFSIQSDPD